MRRKKRTKSGFYGFYWLCDHVLRGIQRKIKMFCRGFKIRVGKCVLTLAYTQSVEVGAWRRLKRYGMHGLNLFGNCTYASNDSM
jgi:hypothetical protein